MDEYRDSKKYGALTLFTIMAEFIIIVIIIFSISDFLKTDNKARDPSQYNIEISNFRQEISNINKSGIKDIQFSLHDIVWLNNGNINEPNPIKATIRAESVKKQKFTKDNIYQVYFVIDLPDLEQTYQVNYVYSTIDKYNSKLPANYYAMAYCPNEQQKIYSNQICRDRYANQAEKIIQSFNFSQKQ